MTQTENKVIQCRRDTAANWASNNPVPKAGELCFETDTGIIKIGDGSTAYNSLVPFRQTTATTTELNKLHSLPTTNTELGYVHGVTSAIQTQLDSKFAKADIQTTFGETLSDEKVASEKLVKNSLDTKQDNITVANNSILKASVLSAMTIIGENNSGRRYDEPKTYAKMLSAAHSTFDSTKFTSTGSPVITDDGILTLKDTSNYVVASFNILNKAFKIKFRVKTPDDITTLHRYLEYNYANQNIIRFNQAYYGSPYNKGEFSATFFTSANNNVNISIPAADANIQASTLYDIELEYTATKAYMRFKEVGSDNFTEYSADTNGEFYTVASAVAWLGYSTNAGGEIDLKYFEVFADNVPDFSGAKTGLDTIKADNYTLTGTPTITTDGVLTSADGSNYLSSKNVSIANKSFKIKFRYKTASSLSTTHAIMSYRIGYNGTPYNIDVIQDSNARFQVVSYLGSNVDTHGTVNSITPSTIYNVEFEFTSTNQYLRFAKDGEDFTEISASNSQGLFPVDSQFAFGVELRSTTTPFGDAQLDLNSIRIYTENDSVYQPCLKIPYTLAANDKKFISPIYEDRAKDMAEQFGVAPYHIFDEDNGNFAFPYGSVEEKIAPKIVVGHYEDGASAWEQYLDRTMIQRGVMVADTEVTFPCSDEFASTNFTLSCPFSAKTTTGFTPSASGTYIAIGKF